MVDLTQFQLSIKRLNHFVSLYRFLLKYDLSHQHEGLQCENLAEIV